MNLIRRAYQSVRKAFAPVPTTGRGWTTVVREPFAGAWQRNQELNAEGLLASPVVYACMTLIANDIGKLQARHVRKDSNGIWAPTSGNTGVWPVLRRPNRYQNHIQFKQWWVMSKLRNGNAYILKERNNSGQVVALYVLDPTLVTPLVTDDGSVYYQLSQDNLSGVRNESVTVPSSEIIHDRMNCLYHPLVGISPLYAAAIAAGIGVSIQNNTLTFFGNAATPSGILVAPGQISPENAMSLKQQWESNYGGNNAGKVAVLGDGMKFVQMGTTAVDSQLIETMRWSDERICSVFHVPAYKVGVGAAPSYNNIEALDRAYYSDCLQSHIEEMEACLDDGLGLDGYTSSVEFDLDGLMRMDSKTLMETLKTGVDAAIVTPNEGRKRLNLAPVVGGDTVYLQQQNYSIEALNERDRNEPFEPAEPGDEQKAMWAFMNTQQSIAAMEKAFYGEEHV